MLERDYIVGDFDNAADLLEFLEQKPCDLIVSDLRLPDMDGFDFVFGITRKRALAAGFIAYLVKPAPMYRLLSVIAPP